MEAPENSDFGRVQCASPYSCHPLLRIYCPKQAPGRSSRRLNIGNIVEDLGRTGTAINTRKIAPLLNWLPLLNLILLIRHCWHFLLLPPELGGPIINVGKLTVGIVAPVVSAD